MKAKARVLSIERHHVKALIDLLDNQAATFLSDAATTNERWRVYFVDTDLLSTFVDGRSKDVLSTWSSLLALPGGGDKKRGQASPAVAALANVTGQAVVRYLFGAFRKTAEIQRRRLFTTPEHEREFKSIIFALLHRQAHADKGWLDDLRDCYLALARHDGDFNVGRDAAREIVRLLETNSDGGAEDRAYSLLRDSIAAFSSHLLAPPGGLAKPFLFLSTDPGFLDLIEISRRQVWLAFSNSIVERAPGIEDILLLKRVVFESHDTADVVPRSFAYFRARVMDWLGSNKAPLALPGRKDIDMQIKIAAREAADLMAIAKINAFGHWLNRYQPPPMGVSWQPVLVSGSRKLDDLLKHWVTEADKPVVQLMHPLALLRRVDLWDPAGTRRLEDADYLDQPHEFALSLIFRSPKANAGAATANVEAFTTSLREQLDLVVAREAEVCDRGLARLHRMLDADQSFDRRQYREAVRDLVTQRFVQTYLHLTELFPGVTNQLPASSLPTLDLPHSITAMSFMAQVRDGMVKNQPPRFESDALQKSLIEDPTGYSALLSSAVGYMARGSSWLSAAQTMSATAVLLAKGRGAAQYPEGNEALYLEAFLKRITLKVTDDIEEFSRTHERMMAEARKTLGQWAAQEGDVAQEQLFSYPKAPTHAEWISYRYRLEDCARDIFVAIVCVLGKRTSELCWKKLSETAQTCLLLHRESSSLIGQKESWPPLHRPSICYCEIQSGISLLQLWLCWRVLSPTDDAESLSALQAYEIELEPIVNEWWGDRKEFGKLLPLLAVVFAQETGYACQWLGFPVDEKQFNVSFAAIDKERFDWLQRLWRDGQKRRRL